MSDKPKLLPQVVGKDAHATELAELQEALQTRRVGLEQTEARERLEQYGPNSLPKQEKDPAWKRFLAQFRDPLVLTLLAAAAIAVFVAFHHPHGSFLSRFADAIAILLIVLLNAVIGYYQEQRAEAALDALQKMTAPRARVMRDGRVIEIDAAEVVPGDVLELAAGDAIAADARLVETHDFATEESALTGESQPTGKNAGAIIAVDAPLGDRETMVFTGTVVVRGKGRAMVTATGIHSELGKIGQMIASIADTKTPLEERLDAFGTIILRVCIALSAMLMAWGFLRPLVFGGEVRAWHVLLLEAVALAVAAIPEGLPAITTITLALGMQRMAKRGAIVRRLPAVETLGAATMICSDKTGTLTQNEMTVRKVYTLGHRYKVTGEGYSPTGQITDGDTALVGGDLPETLVQLLSTASLCNNAQLNCDEEGIWRVTGDPTEGALLTLAEKGGLEPLSVRDLSPTVRELPFDSDRKRMTVVTRDAHGREVAHVKGSVDVLLPRCVNASAEGGTRPLSDEDRQAITLEADSLSSKALRVLALCRRGARESGEPLGGDRLEQELTFLGLVAMQDPPRPGVLEAIATCSKAGIRAVMITGDHKLTARAIAEEIGLWQEGDEAISGHELAQLDDAELDAHAGRLRVFARTTAEQKLRIVRAFKRAGHVVAMTGDGVNDAPALRESHIGIAMGRGGTDVARQASDLILSDDNFSTIVEAVREGRAIYGNIKKFIFFLLSANAGLVVAVFVVSFFPTWPPLTPLMVLWINLVTNGLPALALGIDPPDKGLMEEPPRAVEERLMVFRDYLGIGFVGTIMGLAAVSLYWLSPDNPQRLLETRALAFTLLALSPLIHALSCRSPIRSAFRARPLVSWALFGAIAVSATVHLVAVLVPSLQPVFKTFPISGEQWFQVLLLASLVLPAVEAAKFLNRRRLALLDAPPHSLRNR